MRSLSYCIIETFPTVNILSYTNSEDRRTHLANVVSFNPTSNLGLLPVVLPEYNGALSQEGEECFPEFRHLTPLNPRIFNLHC